MGGTINKQMQVITFNSNGNQATGNSTLNIWQHSQTNNQEIQTIQHTMFGNSITRTINQFLHTIFTHNFWVPFLQPMSIWLHQFL